LIRRGSNVTKFSQFYRDEVSKDPTLINFIGARQPRIQFYRAL